MFDEIARILTLMSRPPNPRNTPLQDDLKGDFDLWFDGGAVKHDTGISKYHFADGTTATTGSSLLLHVQIEFPGGRRVDVRQRQ